MTALHRCTTSPPAPPRALLGLSIGLALAAGCAARQYTTPMTAAELADRPEGDALGAYLGQPAASVGVCDLGASGPHARIIDFEARGSLDRGLREGRLTPARWKGCMELLLRTADPEAAVALLTDVVRAARDLLGDGGLETDLGAQARLEAVTRIILERPPGLGAGPGEMERLVAQLDRDLATGRLGQVGHLLATELVTAVRLENGLLGDQRVDAALLDGLTAAGDEVTLRRCVDRLPDAALREEARRRIIRLHVQASPYPEVRLGGQAVEEAVARAGANPVSLAVHAPQRGWLEGGQVPVRTALVEQRVGEQAARLLGSAGGPAAPSLLPEVALRGTLKLELAGISLPVTVCGDARELDASPCLATSDVGTSSPLARVDGAGVLRVLDWFSESQAVALAGQPRLVLPLALGSLQVAALDWPLLFLTPSDLVLEGAGPAGSGPGLEVLVEAIEPGRLVDSVTAAGRRYQAVVERTGAATFHLVTRGGRGYEGASGQPGMDGSSGTDGSDASCPFSSGQGGSAGGSGGNGGNGGDGGPGGRGGDVRVTVVASGALREDLLHLLQSTILSQGGPGGPGGPGGRGGSGGRGGRGGTGTTCLESNGATTSLSGGSDGASGSDGSSGFAGGAGPPGAPGRVTFMGAPDARP
jgi:hypothetical protein